MIPGMFSLFKNKQTRVRIRRIAVLSLVVWSIFAWVMARALIVVTAEPVEADALVVLREAEALQLAGVPAEQVEVLPQPVSSTYEEAVRLRDYATTQGLRSVLIVTSAYHSRRALWTMRRVFEGSGVEVGLAIAPIGEQSPKSATWWLHISGWRMVAGEYVKLVYYWLRYR
ncbi:MAG: YdcF family protein [Acidobacteria bacterium]|nr:YdcF family protein [Acidobacteriota bacterium]